MSLAIVGAEHPNKRGPGRRFEIQICKPGETVELRPEPKNPVDSRAIGVYSCRDVQIGYIRAEHAQFIGAQLARGTLRAIFQREDTWGAVIRVTFDGTEPVLPVYKPRARIPNRGVDWELNKLPDDEFSDINVGGPGESSASDFYPDEEWSE